MKKCDAMIGIIWKYAMLWWEIYRNINMDINSISNMNIYICYYLVISSNYWIFNINIDFDIDIIVEFDVDFDVDFDVETRKDLVQRRKAVRAIDNSAEAMSILYLLLAVGLRPPAPPQTKVASLHNIDGI